MNQGNTIQNIGVGILIISLVIRIVGRFLDGELAELLADFRYLGFIGGGIWVLGYFYKKYNDKKVSEKE